MTTLRDSLDLEWERIARRPDASQRMPGWAARERALVGFESPAAVLQASEVSSTRTANGLLGALLLSAETTSWPGDASSRRCFRRS